MGTSVDAIHVRGAIRPIAPLDLPEGTRVRVVVPDSAADVIHKDTTART